jgi:hypothetical protein
MEQTPHHLHCIMHLDRLLSELSAPLMMSDTKIQAVVSQSVTTLAVLQMGAGASADLDGGGASRIGTASGRG